MSDGDGARGESPRELGSGGLRRGEWRGSGGLLSRGKVILQLCGFVIGALMLAWLIKVAVDAANDPARTGILESLRAAWSERPWLIVGIAATTAASLVIDGALFWLVLRPVRRLAFMELQWLTFVAALSNFFPVRLGIAVRYAYHLRANRLRFLQCTAWFVAVTLVILASLAAVVVATVVDRDPGLLWTAAVLVVVAVTGLGLRWVVTLGPLRQRLHGWERMLTSPATFWAGALLRVLEVLLWIVRMWCAAEILNLGMDFATVTILGVAAITVMLNPLGRLGFREATTVAVATWLAGKTVDPANMESAFVQLGLLESFGEMLTTIPMGIVALPMVVAWYRTRRGQSVAEAGGVRP